MAAVKLSAAVVSLHIAPHGAKPMQSVDHVTAVAGRGLEGDRYCHGSGTYSRFPGDGRQVTLIQIETIEALRQEYGIAMEPGAARRNIVTCRVALNLLVGRSFHIGAVMVRGTRLCEPCMHLERLSMPGAMSGLIRRGGLRADILHGATIRVGDDIRFGED